MGLSDPTGLAPERLESTNSNGNYIASTFIDPNGKVVEHRDDGDDNIYLVGSSWTSGGSKSGLPIVGHEKPGESYRKGDRVYIDIVTGYGFVEGRKATGAATPIGGPFDIFGFWEAFGMATEESDIDLGLAVFILTKGKKGKMTTSLGVASKIPKTFKQTKKFGFKHGQKVYEYMGKYFSKDVDSHNGGVWKVFKEVGGKLKRIGTADKDLNIFKE